MFTLSLVFSLFLSISDSARILCVFQVPSKTHQAVFRVFTDELLQRGHELVVITTDPNYPKDATPSNLTEIDVHDVVYDIWNAEMEESRRTAVTTSSGVAHSYDIHKNFNKLLLRLIETNEIQKIIKEDNKFDLLILEASFRSLIIFSHFIKAPVILLSSFGSLHNYVEMGVPTQELIYPSMLRKKTHDVAFWEEIYDAYNYKRFENFLDDLDDIQSESFRSIFGPDIPSIKELYNNVDLLMLNQFPVWERTRPVPPNVIHLGGIHVVPGKDLPQDLQEYFNSSTNGVIYVSFGTSMDSAQVTQEKLRIIVDVLSELPYDVLWKWDEEELPGKGKNIKTAKWLPQADILRHPKLKLFITQGGLQSTDEAIAGGVPLIGIPFMHDQFFNCDNYERHKIGLRLDINTLTADEMKAAISLILTDGSYRENVLNLRTQMRDQPQSSLNRAISWTEYVLRHKGAKHLRSPAAHMHWTQYLELELVCLALLLYGLAVIILLALLYFLCVGIGKCYKDYSRRRMINGMLFPR